MGRSLADVVHTKLAHLSLQLREKSSLAPFLPCRRSRACKLEARERHSWYSRHLPHIPCTTLSPSTLFALPLQRKTCSSSYLNVIPLLMLWVPFLLTHEDSTQAFYSALSSVFYIINFSHSSCCVIPIDISTCLNINIAFKNTFPWPHVPSSYSPISLFHFSASSLKALSIVTISVFSTLIFFSCVQYKLAITLTA